MKYLKLWSHPSNYIGATWEGWYVFLFRNRDSDDLANSNFETGLERLKCVASNESVPNDPDDSATVQTVCENHWACGWVEWIAIHESDTAALACAEAIMERLYDYPVLDDNDFSNRETESANQVWKDCYDVKERVAYIRVHPSQFDFQDFSDLSQCVRGNYFAGYASELLN